MEQIKGWHVWVLVALMLGTAVVVFNMALSAARERKIRQQYFDAVRQCQRQCDRFDADVMRVDIDCYCRTPGGITIKFYNGQTDPVILRYREEP